MKSNKIKTQTEEIEGSQTKESSFSSHAKSAEKASECEEDLLNLLAEIITENIVRKIRNGCNRIYKDQ